MGINRFKRLLDLITFIQGNVNVSTYDIMNELEISRSTVFRDLKTLMDCGLPCSYLPGLGYQISSTYMLPIDNITPLEVMALAQLLNQLKLERENPTQQCAAKAIQKFLASLPQSIRDIYQHHAQKHVTVLERNCNTPDVTTNERLSLLLDSIDHRVPVVCDLQLPQNEIRTVRLHPYHLIADMSEWYLWAKVFPEGNVMAFEVERLIRPVQTDNQFNSPDEALTVAWRRAWRVKPEDQMYHIQIGVKPTAPKNFLATQWHTTQQQGIDKSGRYVLSFDIDGLEEIAQWAWQHHLYVEIISPQRLKVRMREMASEMLVQLDA